MGSLIAGGGSLDYAWFEGGWTVFPNILADNRETASVAKKLESRVVSLFEVESVGAVRIRGYAGDGSVVREYIEEEGEVIVDRGLRYAEEEGIHGSIPGEALIGDVVTLAEKFGVNLEKPESDRFLVYEFTKR